MRYMYLRSISIFEVYLRGVWICETYVSSRYIYGRGICIFDVYVSLRQMYLPSRYMSDVYVSSRYMYFRGIYIFEVYGTEAYASSSYMYLRGICIFELYVSSRHMYLRYMYLWGICIFEAYVSLRHKYLRCICICERYADNEGPDQILLSPIEILLSVEYIHRLQRSKSDCAGAQADMIIYRPHISQWHVVAKCAPNFLNAHIIYKLMKKHVFGVCENSTSRHTTLEQRQFNVDSTWRRWINV